MRRGKLRYREVFFAHNGPGPYPCCFCSNSVTFDDIFVHHIDHDRKNNIPSNLDAAHEKCHFLHHKIWEYVSPETRVRAMEAARIANTGRVRTVETQQKISKAKKGQTHTPESKRKMSEAHRGKPRTAEQRSAISHGQKARWERCKRAAAN